jgi:Tic22-like family
MRGFHKQVGLALALTVLATTLHSQPAAALTEEQVVEKLSNVPVFMITDPKGNPLIVNVKDKAQKEVPLLLLFMDQKRAQDTYSNIKKGNTSVKDAQIIVISLGLAFKAIREEAKKKDNKLNFEFLTDASTLNYALTLFKKVDTKATSFPGIPVFYAMGSDGKGKAKGYVTFEKDGKQLIPFYFSQTDIEQNINDLKKSKPDLAKLMSIEVAPLESVITAMLEGKNDTQLQTLTFVPSLTAAQYAQSLQKAAKVSPTGSTPGATSTPAAASAPATSTPGTSSDPPKP